MNQDFIAGGSSDQPKNDYAEMLRKLALIDKRRRGAIDEAAGDTSKAKTYEQLANMMGSLGTALGGGMAPKTDFTGTMSAPLQERSNKLMEEEANAIQAQKELDRLQREDAKFGLEKDKAQADIDLKGMQGQKIQSDMDMAKEEMPVKIEKLKAETEKIVNDKLISIMQNSRDEKKLKADIDNIESQVRTRAAQLGIDQQTIDNAVKRLNFDIYKHTQELNKKTANLTPAQKAVDAAFGKEVAEFYAGNPIANYNKAKEQLNGVIKTLETENVTGGARGLVPEFAQGIIIPKSKATRDTVREVVQRNMREILGAQFTQKEGEMLMDRAYDQSLSEAENAERVRRLGDMLDQAMAAKVDAIRYYESNGTMMGYQGKSPREVLGLPREMGVK